MGCGASSPPNVEDMIPAPGDEPCSFIVKKPMMSSTYEVFTGEGDRKLWLKIENKSSWFASQSDFELKTYSDDLLVKCVIEGTDAEIKREVEWDGDSDDSDYSIDDLFGFDDTEELKVKLKWKIKRQAQFIDPDGNTFANLTVKVKGKSKAELEVQEGDDGTRIENMTSETKVKKVYYKLTWLDSEHTFEFDNGHWQDWNRSWCNDFIHAEYEAKFGVDEMKINTKGNCMGGDGLAVGFAISYFFHPAAYASEMDTKVRCEARDLISY